MSTLKHTAANFVALPAGDANFYVVFKESGGDWHARIQFNGELMPALQDADVRVFCAAPGLLAAAQAAWNCIAELPPTQARVEVAQMLQEAIEKATGQEGGAA